MFVAISAAVADIHWDLFQHVWPGLVEIASYVCITSHSVYFLFNLINLITYFLQSYMSADGRCE